jgi:carbamoylphosphate synthase large subunit
MHADMNSIDIHDFKRLPPASDKEFVIELDLALDEAGVRLLVPTVTEELPKVAEHREAIRRRNCSVFVSPSESVRIANDKWETMQALSARGIAVPSSYCGSSNEVLLQTVAFPMLSKPRCGRGGRGISLHASEDDLPPGLRSDRIFQEFLPGDEFDANLFAHPDGKNITSVVLKKTALRDGVFGNALSVQRVDEPDIAELAEAAVHALRLEGPIDIDIRRGNDGRPFILEINARVGANVCAADEVLIAMIANWRDQL